MPVGATPTIKASKHYRSVEWTCSFAFGLFINLCAMFTKNKTILFNSLRPSDAYVCHRYLGTNFIEILIEIHAFSFKKMQMKRSSVKWWQSCLGPNVFNPKGPRLLIGIKFDFNRLSLITTWISNYTPYTMYDEIAYSFPNFDGNG